MIIVLNYANEMNNANNINSSCYYNNNINNNDSNNHIDDEDSIITNDNIISRRYKNGGEHQAALQQQVPWCLLCMQAPRGQQCADGGPVPHLTQPARADPFQPPHSLRSGQQGSHQVKQLV